MKYLSGGLLLILLAACSSNKQILKSIDQLETDFSDHTGFVLYDIANDQYLIEKNANKYFTPASNTKIITLYTALNAIGDSVPALYYQQSSDSLIFWGTGSPEFLYKNLPQSRVFDFLKEAQQPLYFSTGNFYDKHFGPGWAWDDYYYAFSSEKSPLPVYGNFMTVRKYSANDTFLSIDVPYFKHYFTLGDSIEESGITRGLFSNELEYGPAKRSESFKREVPFHANGNTTANLLSDTLSRSVALINKPLPKHYQTLFGIPADSAYREMMQQSDNFIAEQLLLVCAGIVTDSLKSEAAIRWAQDSLLKNSPDPIVWKDGSGLSRYNLITPRSLVWLWQQLLAQVGQERLFHLISVGGESGTLKNYFKSDPPYIYGKTGTLSNNHNLSGFLISKKGKLFIFSFMNNNYPTESRPVKHRMEKILWEIHEKY